jgi:hypothetical protein
MPASNLPTLNHAFAVALVMSHRGAGATRPEAQVLKRVRDLPLFERPRAVAAPPGGGRPPGRPAGLSRAGRGVGCGGRI